ncbi:MAG: chromate transporter [Chthoniobacterales bacterium]|nr:chromate transporter [Chthoniobacterales bacterium]
MSEVAEKPSLAKIFRVFALIGVTSFGGGIVAYLRHTLVEVEKWLDEEEFMAALEISQTLPGLNSTNMSVIVGRKLRGPMGATVAVLGMVLPGALIVMGLGLAYARFRHDPVITLVLSGVAAAAVGLLLQVTLKIGWKQLINPRDLAFVLVVFVLVGIFHISLVVTLFCVAPLAIWLNRPAGTTSKEEA